MMKQDEAVMSRVRKRKINNRMNKEEKPMSITLQAEKIGFHIVGKLTRYTGYEPSHLYRCYFDEASNKYVLYRGILTIIAPDGSVY